MLLTAVGLDGQELQGVGPRQALARRLGTLAGPCLEGPWEELRALLAHGTSAATYSTGAYAGNAGESPQQAC